VQQRIPVHREDIVTVEEDEEPEMEVEHRPSSPEVLSEDDNEKLAEEVEAIVNARAEPEAEEEHEKHEKPVRVWPELATERANRYKRELDSIREHFEEEIEAEDTTMVSEYADEIFKYMSDIEVSNPSASQDAYAEHVVGRLHA
jgi:hypothetical protein